MNETPEHPAGPDIRVIDTHYLRDRYAASHLLISGGEAAFIDVGTTRSENYLLRGLTEAGLGPEAVGSIIVTHIHLDHAGGAGALMRSCPNATLLVHRNGAPHMVDPARLVGAAVDIYGSQRFTELYKEVIPIPEERVRPVEDGYVLDFRGRPLHFLDTPGHARHHCSIWDPKSRSVFTGDTLGLACPELQEAGKPPFLLPLTAPAAFEPDRLIESIRRIMVLQPDRLCPTHFGPVAADPAAVEGLIDLIGAFDELAREERGNDPAWLTEQVRELQFAAYCRYADRPVSGETFDDLLLHESRLNAEGIAAYRSRLDKKRTG